MKTIKTLAILIALALLLVFAIRSAQAAPAVPPNPSSFYGEIHILSGDGEPSAGSYVEAYVPGIAGYAARDAISISGENLVYAFNVPGDDSYTIIKDGGVPGDTVTFKINGRTVATYPWAGGTNRRLHLHPPKADAGGPYIGMVNEGIDIQATVTDWYETIDVESFSYTWDLDNDGAYDDSALSGFSQAFTSAGTIPVTVKITDFLSGEGYNSTDIIVVGLAGLTGQSYDGAAKPVTVSGVVTPYTAEVTYSGNPTPPTNAGSYAVVVTVKNGAAVIGTLSKTLVIDPRPITLTADDKSKLLGQSDPSLTYAITSGSLVPPDAITGGLTREAGETVGTYAILQGSLTAGSNYAITYQPGTFTIEAVQHTINLEEGWNLVSIDLAPVSTVITDVLATVAGNYDLVYAWDASGSHSGSGNWLKHDSVPASTDTLDAIHEKMGFWIHMLAEDTLEVEGTPAGITTIDLLSTASGWNLVGYPAGNSPAMPSALEDHGVVYGDYTLVYAYHADDLEDPWKLYDCDAPIYANDLTSISPTWGYWILVTKNVTWSIGD